MAAVDIGARDVPPEPVDDLDNLFNYEVDNGLFQDVDTNMDIASKQPTASRTDKGAFGGSLGLDEEIKFTKKRAPIAKLDEARLLSQTGIPRLRRTAKDRLQFKGKGHEYSDIARLLNFYQLWLDDLYPRAKFADGLAMIEKLGHSKRMQTMRKEWINEGKAKYSTRKDDQKQPEDTNNDPPDRPHESKPMNAESGTSERNTSLRTRTVSTDTDSPHEAPQRAGAADDDGLFISGEEKAVDQPPEDDLDALLAEDEAGQLNNTGTLQEGVGSNVKGPDNFDDDEEAMDAIDDMW